MIEDKEDAGLVVKVLLGVAFALIVIGVVVYLIGNAVGHGTQAVWNEMDTKATQNSFEYVQTKKTLLLQLKEDYNKLAVQIQQNKDDAKLVAEFQSQQASILQRMRSEVALIKTDQVPDEVKTFLATHG